MSYFNIDDSDYLNDKDNMKLLNEYAHDIKGCLLNTASGACRLGYFLYQINDKMLYKFSDKYKRFVPEDYLTANKVLKFTKYTFYDYCKDYFNFSRRSVDRFINICLEFSEKTELDDITENIDKKYKSYSVSALAELLNLSEKQREKVTSDMTVSQIRDLKNGENKTDINTFEPKNVENKTDFNTFESEDVVFESDNWNNTISSENVKTDDVPLMKSRTYKKKKYKLASDDYDCFIDTVSGFTSCFNSVSGYLNKGYLIRLVLYKPEG